jgi:putative nucleotidyltransferase with HDIG domain
MASGAAIAIENALLFEERERAHIATLSTLVSALDARERETQAHSRRVQEYSLRLARELGVPEADWKQLLVGALLHDIGKIGISDTILLKPGELMEQEWQEMRQHPMIGHLMLRELAHLQVERAIVLAHHERWDGSGYPKGIAGAAIPLGARIFCVADTLDAVTSDRPYRKRASFTVANEEIVRGAGTQFDPDVVAAFLRVPIEEWQAIRQRAEIGPCPVADASVEAVASLEPAPDGSPSHSPTHNQGSTILCPPTVVPVAGHAEGVE